MALRQNVHNGSYSAWPVWVEADIRLTTHCSHSAVRYVDAAGGRIVAHLNGAYRLHRPEDVAHFTALAAAAFPEFANRIECFGADWLGRQFAIDQGRVVDGEPQVLMLEPGTGEALEIPVSKAAFHDNELVNEPDAAAAYSFFEQWLAAGGARPEFGQCIGYRIPLYLGGADDVTNLATVDFEVYWGLTADMLAQVRGLPAGTRIRDVSISD